MSVADSLMPFGKHKGRPIKQLPSDYLFWMVNELSEGWVRDEALAVLSERKKEEKKLRPRRKKKSRHSRPKHRSESSVLKEAIDAIENGVDVRTVEVPFGRQRGKPLGSFTESDLRLIVDSWLDVASDSTDRIRQFALLVQGWLNGEFPGEGKSLDREYQEIVGQEHVYSGRNTEQVMFESVVSEPFLEGQGQHRPYVMPNGKTTLIPPWMDMEGREGEECPF